MPTESARFDHKQAQDRRSLGRTNQQAWGAVEARRIYGWTWRNLVMHEKKNEEAHELGEMEEVAYRKNVEMT